MAFALCTTALFSPAALAGPEGGQITAGSGSIGYYGATTNINQSSQNLAINWNSFNVAPSETVNFHQPNSSAIALNRILGQDPSQIFGKINANGQVFILNPNGVLFGQGAQVNAGGIVASVHDLSDEKFMAGDYKFANGEGRGSVVNQGSLSAAEGGYVALLAPEARNEGIISARLGTAVIAAGNEVSLNLDNGTLVSYSIDKGSLNALAENKQLVTADGGHVYMTAKAADEIGKASVNNTGIIEARTVENRGGKIILGGGVKTDVKIAGTLDASAASGKGGTIVTTGEKVILEETAKINASGAHGGGDVFVGGGWQGKDAAIHNADVVIVQPNAHIDVSATENGDGGTAVLWSEKFTGFAGTIDSFGGAAGGNGGKVETSSHGTLDAVGVVGTAAASGEDGEWLLDPYNVIIASGGASGTAYAANYTPGQDSTILASSIVASLNAGTNVTITTNAAGGSAGNITVDANIAKTGLSASTLTLSAYGDIIVNNAISSAPTSQSGNSYGRLNVVLTADADNAGGGSIVFGTGGSVTTYHGNFIAGTGDIGSVTAMGNDFTMAQGSFIDVGNGNMDILVKGNITLHENSLRATNSEQWPQTYTNAGATRYNLNNYLSVNSVGGYIRSDNANAAIADIVTSAETRLLAGSIGQVANPIKIAGTADILGLVSNPTNSSRTFPGVAKSLSITNTAGDSYVNNINQQAFSSIGVTLGSQTNSAHRINIMGDQGGTGHINLDTDGSGVLVLATGDIMTGGVPGTNTGNWATSSDPTVFPTSVAITAPNMTFANGSVNTGAATPYFLYGVGSNRRSLGMGTYSASFTATAGTLMTSAAYDATADITAVTASFNGPAIGTLANRLEIAGGTTLNVNNTGGSTFIDSVDNSYTTINLTNVKTVGTHQVHFSSGDHIDYLTDGTNVYVPTIAASGCATTVSCGMLATGSNRTINMTANNGSIVFADNAINTAQGNFSATLASANTEGHILAENDYNAGAQVAQITAANVGFTVANISAPGTIGGGNKHIQIAQGTGASNNTLTVNTYRGNVNIHELTTNHFKTLNTTLNGASAAQTVIYDLAGADDVNFSDDATTVLIDATKVNLSSNNRNWYLSTPSRNIQVDGVSLGTGTYTLNATRLRLNSDVITNDGSITLTGNSGIDLMRSVLVDSNSDNTGGSANIAMTGMISGMGAGYTLNVDSSSANAGGGTINMYSGTNGAAGHFLTGVALTAAGANVNGSQDGSVYLQNSVYSLNGNFSSHGNTYLQTSMTIDTEQGNTANGGNIAFSGYNLTAYYWGAPVFNTATSAAGMNGGNVDLFGTVQHAALDTVGITVNTTGGAGGSAGSINLPAVMTIRNGYANTQSYTGGVITLNGNLTTDKGAVTLTGDTRLATNVVIDTWAATNSQQNGTAGAVTIAGAGVSGNAAGRTLNINTSTDTGGGYFNAPTNTIGWGHNGGAVSIIAGNGGGHYIDTLTVNTTKNGAQNAGTNGTISLGNVGTVGAQTYTGGALTFNNGAVTTDGGNISVANVASLTVAGTSSIDTDRTGGTGNAGTLDHGGHAINGAGTFTIDLSADGGGTSQNLNVPSVGNSTPLTAFTAIARNLNVTGAGVTATGNITLEARGATSDLVLDSNAPVTTTNGLITIAAGRNFINNNATANTGIVRGTGRYLVYSAHPDNTDEAMTGYSKRYSQTYTAGSIPAYATAGNWFLYSVAPIMTVTPDSKTLEYNQTFETSTYTLTGTLLDGDANAGVSGTALYSTSGTGPGRHDIAYTTGLLSSLGYQFADNVASVDELTIRPNPAVSPVPGANEIAKLPDGPQMVPIYTAALNTVATPPDAATPAAESQGTQQGTSSLAGPDVVPNVGNSAELQIGTVRVENGGIKLPGNTGNNEESEESEE